MNGLKTKSECVKTVVVRKQKLGQSLFIECPSLRGLRRIEAQSWSALCDRQ
jgi:hypothetical protein